MGRAALSSASIPASMTRVGGQTISSLLGSVAEGRLGSVITQRNGKKEK